MDFKDIKAFYVSQIQDIFLPYWMNFVDLEYGGILNCINNRGDKLLGEWKFTWSQGRWLWVLSRIYLLAKDNQLPKVEPSVLEPIMKDTFEFISTKSVYGENDACCYLLTRDGQKCKDDATGRYDASIYADCFALIGCSQYAKAVGSYEAAALSHRLYKSIHNRIEGDDFLTEPYPIPRGYRIHGIPMILVNTIQEYMDMCSTFGQDISEPQSYVRKKVHLILDELFDGERCIREHISDNGPEYMLDRHINPGHTLEDCWFLAEYLEKYGELDTYLPRLSKIAKNTFELGWDSECGGLLRFVDKDGGMPRGKTIGTPYEKLILETWDMKLWWPHSEMLYVFPYLYSRTHDEAFAALYEKAAQYVFSTFPNKELGEWIQIRTRTGEPQDKLVALPVKDPFHILRNFIKNVELVCKMEQEGTI